jgi:hypothetical protein
LQPGDIISNAAGSTRFILKTVTPQSDGVYKGLLWFWMEIWNLKILCEYWDLSVNTDNVIVKVDYESVYNPQFLLDADAAKEYMDNLADAIAEVGTNTNIKDTLKLDVPLEGVYSDGEHIILVTVNPDGSLTETPLQVGGELDRTLIQGSDGEEYVVTSDGQVMGVDEFQATGGNSRLMDNYNEEKEAQAQPTVTFSASPNQQYGFDAYTEIKTNIQNEYTELKPSYRPAFKSVASYAADKVQTNGAGQGITFRDEMGLPPIGSGNELTVRGGAGGSNVALYAYLTKDSTEEIAGKLHILSFDRQVKKLYIISVNNAALPDAVTLRNELNRIYAPAVVSWDVSVGQGVAVAFPEGQMRHGGSGAGKVYNADQKAVLKAFGEMDRDALYLFFVDRVTGKEGDYAGYMPLQYQGGFIYDSPAVSVIAHELAHGAFTLEHTFGNNPFIASQGATANLMDYAGGAELWKHQWLLISNPKNLWFKSWQEEEEGEAANIEKGITLKEAGYFVAPDKHIVKLPAKAEVLYMCDYEEHLKNTGYLYKFKINGNVWKSEGEMSSGGYLFDGYYSNGQKYSEAGNTVNGGDTVQTVRQNIIYSTDNTAVESRELSLQKVRIKTTAYSDFYNQAETLGQEESVNVSTSCGGTNEKAVDWGALKPGFEQLNQRLNTAWGVSLIDREGASHTLATGTKGAVQYAYNNQSKKWEAKVTGIPDEEVSKIVADAINSRLEAFQIDETGKAKVEKTTTTPISTEDGGEFRFGDGLRWYEWGVALCDAGVSIYERGNLPATFWNQDNDKYKDYPLHVPGTMAGVSDGAIEEVLSIPLLVKFGIEIVTDKELAQALWNSVKNINLESIKDAAVDFYNNKIDAYTSDKPYIVGYTAGKDAVQVATLLSGTAIFTKGAKEGLDKGIKETGEKLARNIRKFTQKEIDDYVKFATKNPDANKVMLGMWDDGKPTSYVSKAGKDYTCFDMGNEWDDIKALVNGSNDEMWRINKQFIDEQYKLGKEFWSSHNPFSPGNEQIFAREITYLIDLGVKDFEKTGDLWRAIW